MGIEDTARGLVEAKGQLDRAVAFEDRWGICPSEIRRIKLLPVGRWDREAYKALAKEGVFDGIGRVQVPAPGSIRYHSIVWTRSGEEVFFPHNVIRLIEGEFQDVY